MLIYLITRGLIASAHRVFLILSVSLILLLLASMLQNAHTYLILNEQLIQNLLYMLTGSPELHNLTLITPDSPNILEVKTSNILAMDNTSSSSSHSPDPAPAPKSIFSGVINPKHTTLITKHFENFSMQDIIDASKTVSEQRDTSTKGVLFSGTSVAKGMSIGLASGAVYSASIKKYGTGAFGLAASAGFGYVSSYLSDMTDVVKERNALSGSIKEASTHMSGVKGTSSPDYVELSMVPQSILNKIDSLLSNSAYNAPVYSEYPYSLLNSELALANKFTCVGFLLLTVFISGFYFLGLSHLAIAFNPRIVKFFNNRINSPNIIISNVGKLGLKLTSLLLRLGTYYRIYIYFIMTAIILTLWFLFLLKFLSPYPQFPR